MKWAAFFMAGFFAFVSPTTAFAAGNATAGKSIFQIRCSECHWVDKWRGDSLGPNLDGFFGRPAASEQRYCCYSSAFKQSGLTWDEATLDKWLAGPAALVPGTRMAGFPGLDSETARADVIAYLSTLTIKPDK